MTVEFEPKKEGCFCFGAPNDHVFDLLKKERVKQILGDVPLSNDPMDVTEVQSLALAAYIKENKLTELKRWRADADMYAEFFESCGGFTTH